MPRYQSKISNSDRNYLKNRERLQELVGRLQADIAKAVLGGPEKTRQKQLERGKLLPRDRISLLLDKNTSFLEIAPLAANGLYKDEAPAAGIICGIGRVHGTRVMIVANDATVKGGTYFPMTVKKHLRAQEIALENHLPCIYLVDSGGAYLPLQDEVFPDRDHFGRIFYNQARLSARNIPQIAVVMGSCTAGGAYVPAMCDESIIVKNQGTIFLGGPPLVKAATGENVDAESLGGGDVHTSRSGLCDHLADDEPSAIRICREIVSHLKRPAEDATVSADPPYYAADELYGIIPADSRYPFDAREIVARLVDDSNFLEFKRNYGKTLLCCFSRIEGMECGIVANNGILFSESALKGTHFIELCEKRGIPLIFLQNITGFMVGKQFEHEGIAKHGAKMVTAVATASVPKITVIIGGSFGAGNYAMSGRAYQPRFLFSWPNARISVMGGPQAASVLATVKREGLESRGESWPEADEKAFRDEVENSYEAQGNAWYATARLWDDGIIDPVDTRQVLASTLSICMAAPMTTEPPGIYRM